MKNSILILTLLISSLIYAQEDYQVEINGKVIDVELSKNYKVKVKNKIINIKVSVKDTLAYNDNFLSFKYPKEYKITKSKVDAGIEQLLIMTAEGSGVIIQEYSAMDPSMLNELMIKEVTKESINYGFVMKREEYERTLDAEKKLKISRVVLTYKDEINIYEITSIGKKDTGIIIMTMEMNDNENSIGRKLIKMVWKTLNLN